MTTRRWAAVLAAASLLVLSGCAVQLDGTDVTSPSGPPNAEADGGGTDGGAGGTGGTGPDASDRNDDAPDSGGSADGSDAGNDRGDRGSQGGTGGAETPRGGDAPVSSGPAGELARLGWACDEVPDPSSLIWDAAVEAYNCSLDGVDAGLARFTEPAQLDAYMQDGVIRLVCDDGTVDTVYWGQKGAWMLGHENGPEARAALKALGFAAHSYDCR